MEILVYILAIIGLACIVKHIRVMPCTEGCYLCGWQKMRVEEKEEQGEGEKRTGSRYGSNPIEY
jgi:hypothetical protein